MYIKSVKSRVFLIFVVFLFAMSVNSIWSVINFRRLNNSIERILDSNYKSIVAAQKMIASIERQDSLQLSYLFTKEREYVKNFTLNEEEFLLALKDAQNNITEEGEGKIVNQIAKEYADYAEEFDNFLFLEKKQSEYYFKEIFPKFESIKNLSKDLVSVNQNAMLVKRDEASVTAKKAVVFTFLAAISTIILGVFIISYLIAKILKQFDIFVEKIEGVSREDYSQTIPENLDKEFNKMGLAFNQMAQKLEGYKTINIKKLMTEKRKAEAIVESISDGIIVTDMENNIVLVNRAAEELLNIEEKELLEQPFLHAINNKKIYDSVQEVLNNEEIKSTMKQLEVSLNKGEEVTYCKVYINSIISKSGERLGVVTLLQDVTKAKELDQMKDNFVSTVSHEFRTPLTSIGMAVELLADSSMGKLSDMQRELVSAIKLDNDRLKLLIKDLLDLSRLESRRTPMNFQECDIKEIINFAVKPLRNLCENKDVTLEMGNIDNSIPVIADFNKISVVLTNFIGNAIKYGKEGKPNHILVEAFRKNENLIVSVKDEGRGIPQDQLEKIFNKYIQVKVSNDGKIEGTGLGLSISKEIIKNHNGEIWVDSKLGEGSTFYFSLRCKKD
ncbi:MAG: ATP-binding protein [Fusobacterium sp.]|nr:ATP-binding protein [Fusobacterium sp.]MDO5788044.1 ATP-binding protein [Fusobacterium sp.]